MSFLYRLVKMFFSARERMLSRSVTLGVEFEMCQSIETGGGEIFVDFSFPNQINTKDVFDSLLQHLES